MARRGILLHIDGPIVLLVPNGRLVVPVHNVQFHINIRVERFVAAVTGTNSESESGSLKIVEGGNKKSLNQKSFKVRN